MNLEYINTLDGDLVVKLRGEMDAQGCTHIRTDLEQIVNSKNDNNIILDMSLVSFLDSSGIGVIVFLYKRLKVRGRQLKILNVNGQPQELIELLRIDTVIPLGMASPDNSFSAKKLA